MATLTPQTKAPRTKTEMERDIAKIFEANPIEPGAVDPLDIAVPRAGEHSDPNADVGDGQQPESQAAPTADTQPEPAPAPAASEHTAAPAPAADAQPDIWADAEEVEYSDEDAGTKYKVRVPKPYVQKVKDGWAMRSVMDRNSRYLGNAKATLEPIIASGEFYKIQPLLDLAMQDPEFAATIGEVYARRVMGQPIALGDVVAQATPQQRQAAEAHLAAGTNLDDIPDPLVRNIISEVSRVVDAKIAPFNEQIAQTRLLQENQLRAQQQQRYAESQAQRAYTETWQELRAVYPSDFTGGEDDKRKMASLWNYAQRAGFIPAPGPQGYDPQQVKLAMRLAYREQASTAIPSPAVQALSAGQIEANARAAAANAVAGRTSGGSTITNKQAPSQTEKLKAIKSVKKDGTMKKPQELAAEVFRAMEQS